MALKRGPNLLKNGPNSLKRGQCYVIFGQNEAIFRPNTLKGIPLRFWWMPTINKPNLSKALQPIMVDTPAIDFYNHLSKCILRRWPKKDFLRPTTVTNQNMGSVLQSIITTHLCNAGGARAGY
jgi:hypothetical protein